MFTARDYAIIYDIVFNASYPGYKPNVVESPNGDGKFDSEKRYAHVAIKYLDQYKKSYDGELREEEIIENSSILEGYLNAAHEKSVDVAVALGVPREFWPDINFGALRILEYPAGAIANEHKDFDLFTLMCYRNIPECFEYVREYGVGFTQEGSIERVIALPQTLTDAQKLNPQIHFGEILEVINKNFVATNHKVVKDPLNRAQHSMVYFSIPNHSAKLPTGVTVADWLAERMSRSRKTY